MSTDSFISITQLKSGDEVEIVDFTEGSDPAYRKKLLSLGLTRGAKLKVLRTAPFGDPLEVEIRGFLLSLRKKEADILKLRRIA